MSTWTNDELKKVGEAKELQIAPLRQNGKLRNEVTIWIVRVDEDLFVRSYTGPGGVWFRGALETHKGLVKAGGVEKDVNFLEEIDPHINEQIDAAYRNKYGRHSPYVSTMITPEVRATTLKLVPR